MPIQANIPLGVNALQLPQQDPNQGLNALARAMQIRGLQDEQQVNALRVQDMQRTSERRNKLDSLLGGFSGKPEELGSTLLKGGFLDEAGKVEKDRRENLKADAEAEAKRLEVAHKRMDSWGQAMGFVRQNPTPQAAAAAVQHLVTMGVIPQEQAQAALASAGNDPQTIAQWATQGFQAALQAKDQLPKYDTRNLGGSTQMTATDPVTGQVRVVNSVQNTQSPDAQLQAQTSTANNQRSVGASYANAAATREIANATRDSARIQANQNTEMKMADDYRAQSKPFKEVADAYRQINATLDKATTSPAATLAAATKFMKLLDPGSVVRESELGMALAASGVFDRLTNYHNTLMHGRVLTAQQTQDFKNITQQIYTAAQQQQQQIDGNYRKQAETYGLRPNMVVQDLGQNTPARPPGLPDTGAIDAELKRRGLQ